MFIELVPGSMTINSIASNIKTNESFFLLLCCCCCCCCWERRSLAFTCHLYTLIFNLKVSICIVWENNIISEPLFNGRNNMKIKTSKHTSPQVDLMHVKGRWHCIVVNPKTKCSFSDISVKHMFNAEGSLCNNEYSYSKRPFFDRC